MATTLPYATPALTSSLVLESFIGLIRKVMVFLKQQPAFQTMTVARRKLETLESRSKVVHSLIIASVHALMQSFPIRPYQRSRWNVLAGSVLVMELAMERKVDENLITEHCRCELVCRQSLSRNFRPDRQGRNSTTHAILTGVSHSTRNIRRPDHRFFRQSLLCQTSAVTARSSYRLL